MARTPRSTREALIPAAPLAAAMGVAAAAEFQADRLGAPEAITTRGRGVEQGVLPARTTEALGLPEAAAAAAAGGLCQAMVAPVVPVRNSTLLTAPAAVAGKAAHRMIPAAA